MTEGRVSLIIMQYNRQSLPERVAKYFQLNLFMWEIVFICKKYFI